MLLRDAKIGDTISIKFKDTRAELLLKGSGNHLVIEQGPRKTTIRYWIPILGTMGTAKVSNTLTYDYEF